MVWVTVTIFALILIYSLKTGNSINLLQTKSENEFVSLNEEIVKRYDMIPDFLRQRQSVSNPDKKLVENIIRARNLSMSAHQCVLSEPESRENFRLLLGAESRLNHFLRVLDQETSAAGEESSPVSRSFRETSERYKQACKRFNSAILEYNNAIEEFPASMVATMLAFQSGIPFETMPASETQVGQ